MVQTAKNNSRYYNNTTKVIENIIYHCCRTVPLRDEALLKVFKQIKSHHFK
jgi:hypothetical protein